MDLPSHVRVLDAARLKAEHPIANADACAVATAMAHGATLLTRDPEIRGSDPAWPAGDLRW